MEQVCLDDAIAYSRNIMLFGTDRMRFSEFSRGFFNSNECINGYLSQIDYQKNRALSVLSSGDHVFSLIHDGVKEIDAFDLNKLQYYAYYLRRAFALAFSYDDFFALTSFFCNNYDLRDKLTVLDKVKEFLPLDVYSYYSELIQYALMNRDAEFGKLYFPGFTFRSTCNFLQNKEEYEKLKKGFETSKVNLYFGNALDIPKMVPGHYDIVLLSNISDYLCHFVEEASEETFKAYIQSYLDITNAGGVVVNYFFDYIRTRVINEIEIPLHHFPENSVFPIQDVSYPAHGYYLARKPKVAK